MRATRDEDAAEFGELLLAWVDSSVLLALAEQLDVNPPAELQLGGEQQHGGSFTGKLTRFVELGADRNFSKTASQSSTYRQASAELRLARVLRVLLLENRLMDPLSDFAAGLTAAIKTPNPVAADSELETLARSIGLMRPLSLFQTLGRKLAEGHLWVILDGRFEVCENEGTVALVLREHLSGYRYPVPEELSVEAPFGATHVAWNEVYLTEWGKRRLVVGAHVDLCVFGFADRFDGECNALSIAPIAVFERVGHTGVLLWDSVGATLREQQEAGGGGDQGRAAVSSQSPRRRLPGFRRKQ